MANESDFWKARLRELSELDKPSRISEILFGLIMVLTFTGTISVSTVGRQEISELLWAALGCNLAWGLVDAVMYLMNEVIDRAHGVKLLNRIKLSDNISETRKMVKESISSLFSYLMEDEEIDRLGVKLKNLPDLPVRKSLTFKDFKIAGEIFLLVFLSTFPVTLPFLFSKNVALAMRISNCIALILLFIGGFSLAKYSGIRPVLTGLIYSAIGIFLVAFTIALGG